MNEFAYYPRIFSLATAGIKHHGYQDYIFHPLKTDFVGDSGFGKSMIADMLQLIFVGISEFRPGTDDSTRKPTTMILTDKKHSGIGYCFLNLEVAPENYIVIGLYLEKSLSRVRYFIIQAGYEWENEKCLTPLSQPLSHLETIVDDKLLPIEDFVKKIEQTEMDQRRIRTFHRAKPYHKVLANNGISAIDFTRSEQKLKDYAYILYSLARGKSKKSIRSDSERLKSFLFGDQDARDIVKKFRSGDAEWHIALEDYDNNKEEIRRVQKISEQLNALEHLSKKKASINEQYLYAKAHYHHTGRLKLSSDLQNKRLDSKNIRYQHFSVDIAKSQLEKEQLQANLKTYNDSSQRVKLLKSQLEDLLSKQQAVTESYINAQEKYQLSQSTIKKVEKVASWVRSYNGSLSVVEQHFFDQKRNQRDREVLQDFTMQLTEKGLLNAFETSLWLEDYSRAKTETKEKLIEIEKQLRLSEALRAFSNLDDPDSLARWAIERGKSLSSIEESILLYFQALPRDMPVQEEGKRYLPSPEKLFESIITTGQNEQGFWLNLSGVYEFIELKNPQCLADLKTDTAQAKLEQLLQRSDEDHQKLTGQKEQLERLQHFLGYEGAEKLVEIYKKRQDIEGFSIDSSFPASQSEFEDLVSVYKDRESAYRTYRTTSEAFAEAKEVQKKHIADKAKIEAEIDLKTEYLDSKDPKQIKADIEDLESAIHILENKRKAIDVSHEQSSFYKQIYQKEKVKELQILSTDLAVKVATLEKDIKVKEEALEDEGTLLEEAVETYKQELEKDFEIIKGYNQQPHEELKEILQTMSSKFESKYEHVVGEFSGRDAYKLKGEKDVGVLAYTLLPKVFSAPDISTSIAEHITTYLSSINEKNRRINQNRIDFLVDIFEKVMQHYYSYIRGTETVHNFV